MKEKSFRESLRDYLRAGYPAIAVNTSEETRALGDIFAAAKDAKKNVAVWSTVQGLRTVTPAPRTIEGTNDPIGLFGEKLLNTVVVCCDLQLFPFANDPLLARSLREYIAAGAENGSSVVLLGPSFKPFPSVEKLITILDYSLPTREDLESICGGIAESAGKKIEPTPELLASLGGLATSEAENALALSLIEAGGFSPEIVFREKISAVKRSGILEIIPPDPRGLDAIGGMANLKPWLRKRKASFGNPDLPQPLGIIIVGVPGTGKSLAAKCTGTLFGIPTVRLDVGAVMGSLVGESERNMREALALAEACSPCVLWLDEIEKGLAGSGGSGSNDSGTTKRVLGTFLTWLQERKGNIFPVATANDISALPPELYRRGRWDEIFAVDLPTESERVEIWRVQLAKYKVDAVKASAQPALVEASDKFTGAEIEAAVRASLYDAFDQGVKVNAEILVSACREIRPLAEMAKAQVSNVREWARNNARNVGGEEVKVEATVGKRKLS